MKMSNEMKNSAGSLNHFQTKERSANFSKAEIDRLQSLIEKYKDVLLCKKTDGTSVKQKEHVWSCIASEFNAVGETPRTTKQLKYKFENLKRTVKKEASMERQHMYKTGGGRLTPPPQPSTGSEDTTNWLKSIMSTSIDGLEAVYDDDVILKETVEIVPIKDDKGALSPSMNWVFDTSTPHSSLKRPVSSPLKRLTKKRRLDEENVRRALHKKKIEVLDGLHDLEMQKVKDSIAQQKELHEQLLRHREEVHKLELKKIELEIQILESKIIKE